MFHFYHHPMSPYSQKIFFLLEEAGRPYDLQMIDLVKREHRSSVYTAINPTSRVPAIKDGDFTLFESNAIMRYVVRKFELHEFYPIGLKEQAEVDMWWEFCSHHINKPFMDLVWHKTMITQFGGKPDGAIIAKAERDLARDLPLLENHLTGRSHIVGASLTLADVNLIPFAYYGSRVIAADQWPSLQTWVNRVASRQAWKNVLAYSG